MAYKEIVTKAIIAKGKKKYQNNYELTVDNIPSTILGCWIINHKFSANEENNVVTIDGTYDINIWYSYDNDTKTTVLNKQIAYQEKETLNSTNKEISNTSVVVRALEQPTCTSAKAQGNVIKLDIEKELGIELIGDTKVKISSVEAEDDDWLDLENDNNIDKINTEYINEHS